jgi:hypothetical protein
VFSSDLMETIGLGCSLVVGTVAADGEPRATRAWAACVVDADRRRLRVLVGADDPVSVANLANGRIALTGANVRTLRSAQLKGRVVRTEPPTTADLDLVAESSAAFFRAIHETDGNPLEIVERLHPAEVIAVEVDVEELFDQSPGPAAGAAVHT